MKVLITGASGLLGREIKSVFDKVQSWDVVGTAFSRAQHDLRKLDLRSSPDISQFLDKLKPDVVIHSAAERNYGSIAKNEKDAVDLNVTATETIAKTVHSYGGYVLYISTNLVFDGSKPPYKTSDDPKPSNTYGELKLAGEKILIEHCPNAGILRLPLLFGQVEDLRESGVSSLLALLLETSGKKVVSNYEQKYPTSTYDVAMVCKQMIEHYEKQKTLSGIFHWCSNERFTKYQMIEVLSKVFRLPMAHIEASSGPVGRHIQAYDCGLDTSKLEEMGIGHRTKFEECVSDCLNAFLK